jgi:hypothetical protein
LLLQYGVLPQQSLMWMLGMALVLWMNAKYDDYDGDAGQ